MGWSARKSESPIATLVELFVSLNRFKTRKIIGEEIRIEKRRKFYLNGKNGMAQMPHWVVLTSGWH